MAKARGNKLVPPANFSRNPMQQGPTTRNLLFLKPGHPDYVAPKLTYQQQYRISNGQNPNNMDFIRGVDDLDEDGNPLVNGGLQELGGPQTFNPQNQDVLNRAASALQAIRQDRLAPQFGGAQGYAAPGQNANVQGSPMLNQFVNGVGRGIQAIGQTGKTLFDQYNSSDRQNPMFGGAQGYAAPGANGSGIGSASDNSPRSKYYQGIIKALQSQVSGTRSAANQIDALRKRSQQDNPAAPPAPAYNPMQAEIDQGTRQGNIMFEPGAGSSAGATRNFRRIPTEDLNGMTAGTVNGYNGNTEYARNPMRLDPETKFNLAEGNARRIVGGGAAADPTNMGGRFGGAYGANLDADATAIAEGRAVRTADGNVVYHTGTPESAQKAYMSARANGYGRTPEQEAARHAEAVKQAQARANKHQAFKDATGGMNYRQYDRMQSSNALTMKAVDEGRLSPEAAMHRMQTRADKALRRAGNPMAMGAANGGRLFPDLLAGKGGRAAAPQNPMAAVGEAFKPGGVVTPDGRANAKTFLKAAFSGGQDSEGKPIPPSSFMAGTGATGEEDNIQDIHFGIQQQLQSGVQPSDQDLQTLYGVASAMDAAHRTPDYDPFDMTYGIEGLSDADVAHTKVFGPMYKELAGMKNPSPEQLKSWWGKFSEKVRPDTSMFNLNPDNKPVFSWGVEYPAGSDHLKGSPSVNPNRNPMLR